MRPHNGKQGLPRNRDDFRFFGKVRFRWLAPEEGGREQPFTGEVYFATASKRRTSNSLETRTRSPARALSSGFTVRLDLRSWTPTWAFSLTWSTGCFGPRRSARRIRVCEGPRRVVALADVLKLYPAAGDPVAQTCCATTATDVAARRNEHMGTFPPSCT